MSAVLEADPVAAHSPAQPGLRHIKIGILGLGQVGQAVARLAPEALRLKEAGLRFRVAGALVRDIDKPRRCPRPARITTNPAAFLRGHYDVVIEALGTIEPARSIVSRLLGRGIPVVTANKALVAAHGSELAALASRRGTTLRFEAAALAGVPFLGAFNARPLVSDVRQFTAVVNGTSNFILSKLEAEGCTFAAAVAESQALGYSEPDATRDVGGLDAADKLALLSAVFGWGSLPVSRIETRGISELSGRDLAIARRLGGTIKPVVFASRGAAGVSAFVGPAFVPAGHPLGSLRGALSGIALKGTFVSDLFFSGPGAGPEVTAATILDDVVEAVTSTIARPTPRVTTLPRLATLAAPPVTGWLVRAAFPGVVPDPSTVAQLFASHGLETTQVTDAIDDTRWVQVAPAAADVLTRALIRVGTTHRVHTFAIRTL